MDIEIFKDEDLIAYDVALLYYKHYTIDENTEITYLTNFCRDVKKLADDLYEQLENKHIEDRKKSFMENKECNTELQRRFNSYKKEHKMIYKNLVKIKKRTFIKDVLYYLEKIQALVAT